MRCDRHLKYAEYLPQDAHFPIILPCKNCVTKLIVKHHEKNNHASGTNQCWQLYQHASGSFLVVKKSGNGRRNAMNVKEEKLKLQDKLWPLSHRSDLDYPCELSHRLLWIMVDHSSLCSGDGHVNKNVTCVCLPAWQREQSIWKWPMHLTRTRS